MKTHLIHTITPEETPLKLPDTEPEESGAGVILCSCIAVALVVCALAWTLGMAPGVVR